MQLSHSFFVTGVGTALASVSATALVVWGAIAPTPARADELRSDTASVGTFELTQKPGESTNQIAAKVEPEPPQISRPQRSEVTLPRDRRTQARTTARTANHSTATVPLTTPPNRFALLAQAPPTRPADQPVIETPSQPSATPTPETPATPTPETPTPETPAPETPAAPASATPMPETPAAPAADTPNAPGSAAEAVDGRAPEALNPAPNPLNFPTRPEEVRITGTQPITLQQALELAQRNNRQLQETQLQLAQIREQVREAQAALEPSLDANVSLSNSTARVQTPTLGGTDTSIRNSTALVGTLQASYTLFSSGQRIANIRSLEGQARAQILQIEIQAEQLRLDVSNDYYLMQQRDEEVRIARQALAQAELSLRDAQAQEQAGVGTRFDVLQAQVEVANSQQEVTQSLSEQLVARRQLSQRLGLAEGLTISAADAIAKGAEWDLSLEDSVVLAYRNRAELEQQLVQREVALQRRRAALGALGPQISVFGNYRIANQDLLDGGDFLDSVQVGAQVQLSILDGGAARARARQRNVDRQLAENRFAEQRETVRFQVEQAYLSLQANEDNIDTTRQGVVAAQESLRLARLRFQAGVGTQSDVLRAQTELTRAEVNALNAVLGYNRSLVSLQRAVSNLPGNLAESP